MTNNRRQPTPKKSNVIPYRSAYIPPSAPVPLLTIDRAIADGLCPTSLRQVAAANDRKSDRRQAVADNLRRIADKLELLGFGRVSVERKVAA